MQLATAAAAVATASWQRVAAQTLGRREPAVRIYSARTRATATSCSRIAQRRHDAAMTRGHPITRARGARVHDGGKGRGVQARMLGSRTLSAGLPACCVSCA